MANGPFAGEAGREIDQTLAFAFYAFAHPAGMRSARYRASISLQSSRKHTAS
jgi:hypothetical protein